MDGLVTDARGKPVAGARVRAIDREAVSDGQGRFQLAGVPEGSVLVTANGHRKDEPVSGSVYLKPDQDFLVVALFSPQERRLRSALMPPIRAEKWVQGRPPADGYAGKIVLLYRVGRPPSPEHGLHLETLAEVAKRYAKENVVVICLYPTGTDPATVQADVVNFPQLLAATDEPGRPGGKWGVTEAFAAACSTDRYSMFLCHRGGGVTWARWDGRHWEVARAELVRAVEEAVRLPDVHVTVLEPDGRPAAGARLAPMNRQAGRAFRENIVTGQDGTAVIYAVSARPPCTICAFDMARDLAGQGEVQVKETLQATIPLSTPPPVTGRIVDEAGRPIERAFIGVTLHSPEPTGGRIFMAMSYRTGADGRFRIGCAPPGLGVLIRVSAPNTWREDISSPPTSEKAPRDMGDVVLYQAGMTLRLTVVGLDGKPVPDVRIMFGESRSGRTDGNGVAVIEGLPNKPVRFSMSKLMAEQAGPWAPGRGALFGSSVFHAAPGERRVALALPEDLAKLRAGVEARIPPWRVSKWVKGTPIAPEAVAGRSAVVAVIGEDMPPDEQESLVKAMIRWQEEHGEHLAASLCIFPAGTSDEAIGRLVGDAPGIAVALDVPVGKQQGNPGYTDALWRAWYVSSFPCCFQNAGGEVRFVFRSARLSLLQDVPFAKISDRLDDAARWCVGKAPVAVSRQVPLPAEDAILWRANDPFDPNTVWIGVRNGVGRLDTRTNRFRLDEEILGIAGPNPVGAAFTKKLVLVGTGRGLIAYVRAQGAWNRMAPGGRIDLLEATVTRISQEGDRITAELQSEAGTIHTWSYADERWTGE